MEANGKTELLEFIRGTGKFTTFGTGIHIYPGRDDNNQRLFGACLELESEGLICRGIDDPGHVFFIPLYLFADKAQEHNPQSHGTNTH